MRKYPIKYSAWISLLAILLQSCALTGYQKVSGPVPVSSATAFANTFERGLFKTGISVHGHEFSGLILLKNSSPGHYRISFFNELGMSFLDGDLVAGSSGIFNLEVHKIYGPLDRKALIKALEESFRLVLGRAADQAEPIIYQNKKNKKYLVEYARLKRLKYYAGFENAQRPELSFSTSGCNNVKAKATFVYSGDYPGSPAEINLFIKGPGLEIHMKRIE
jgi:hypothetical protein